MTERPVWSEWQCCLVHEGSSDAALATVLEALVVRMTGQTASVSPRPELKGSVASKIAKVREEGEDLYDLVLVHRDADRAGPAARAAEIRSAGGDNLVPVVPVTMTETWALAALLDDDDYRDWLKREEGVSLGTLEGVSDPKALLRRALSRREPRGRLIDNRSFGRQRRALLTTLNPSGSVSQLPAWQALLRELSEAIQRVHPWVRPGPSF